MATDKNTPATPEGEAAEAEATRAQNAAGQAAAERERVAAEAVQPRAARERVSAAAVPAPRGLAGVPEEVHTTIVRTGNPEAVAAGGEGEGQQGATGPNGEPLAETPGLAATMGNATPFDPDAARRLLEMTPAEREIEARLQAWEASDNPPTTTVPGGRYVREDGAIVDANGNRIEDATGAPE